MNEKHETPSPCDLNRVSAAVDGELDEREQRLLRAHLETCAACRAAYEEYQRIASHCQALPQAAAPSDLVASIKRAARSQTRPTGVPWWPAWLLPRRVPVQLAYAAAAVVLLALFAIVPLLVPGGPAAHGVVLVASAEGEVAGLDLEFAFDAPIAGVDQVLPALGSGNALVYHHAAPGRLRVSMASAKTLRTDGEAPLLELLPTGLQPQGVDVTGLLRLVDARAYRPDGTRVPIVITQVPLLPPTS